MAELIIEEQDIINAICLHQADQQGVPPETVEVELCYEDEEGFYADVYAGSTEKRINTFEMTQALRSWIEHQLHQDPYAAGIKMLLDDERGIIAALL